MKKINPTLLIGILLIGLGAFAMMSDQMTYTRHEKVLDIGPLQASVEKKEEPRMNLPMIFGIIVVIAGIALIAIPSNRR